MTSTARPGVLQVVLSLGTGGTERLVIDITQRLCARFRMAVCCLDTAGSCAHELTERGIEVTALGRSAGFRPSLGRRIAAIAKRHDAGIIHCHHYSPFVYGRIATMMSPRTRLVFTEHGRLSDGPPGTKRRIVNPVLSRLPADIFSVSQALRESMVGEGFPRARVGVIYNGIEPGRPATAEDRAAVRRALGIPPDALVVGTVARLDAVKDLGAALRGFAALRSVEPRAHCVIVGDGDDRNALQGVTRELGLDDAVHFLGIRNDVRRVLAAFDVYVNSSVFEGISLTILEAMSAGLPVVATAVGGTPEVIAHDTNGVLVPARDAATLGAALIALAASPSRRHALGSAARRSVDARFTLDGMVAQYERVYRRLAG